MVKRSNKEIEAFFEFDKEDDYVLFYCQNNDDKNIFITRQCSDWMLHRITEFLAREHTDLFNQVCRQLNNLFRKEKEGYES